MLSIRKSHTKEAGKRTDTWEFRYYEATEQGERRRKSCIVGTVEKLPAKAHAQKAVEALLQTLNSETPQQRLTALTFGAICDRYVQEEMPERYSCKVLSIQHQKSSKAALGRFSTRKDSTDDGRGLAEESPYGLEIQGTFEERDAPDVSVCRALGSL